MGCNYTASSAGISMIKKKLVGEMGSLFIPNLLLPIRPSVAQTFIVDMWQPSSSNAMADFV
jgi:hypothetical protein